MGKLGKTYQQRLFDDEQLGLPEHDSIVRWADKLVRQRPGSILDLVGIRYTIDADGILRGPVDGRPVMHIAGTNCWYGDTEKVIRGAAANLLHLLDPAPPLGAPVHVSQPEWEPVLKGTNGGVAGALDLRIHVTAPETRRLVALSAEWLVSDRYVDHTQFEKDFRGLVICCDGKRFWDVDRPDQVVLEDPALAARVGIAVIAKSLIVRLEQHWQVDPSPERRTVIFEAKTEIRSVGELIRQLQVYRMLVGEKASIVVVAPAAAFKGEAREILAEQRVHTLVYQSNS